MFKKKRGAKRNLGFTLIELLVIIAIVGVLAGIATPGFIGFLNNQRLSSATSELFTAMNQTKSRARRNKLPHFIAFRNAPYAQYSVPQAVDSPAEVLTVNCNNLIWKDLGADNFPLQFDMNNTASFRTLPTANCSPRTRFVSFDKNGFVVTKGPGAQTRLNSDIRFFLANNPRNMRCIRARGIVGTLIILDQCEAPQVQ